MGDRLVVARVTARVASVAAGVALLLVACATTPRSGVSHVVRRGENIYRIALYYGVESRDVIRANRIHDVSRVPVGKRLWIPGASKLPPDSPLVASVRAAGPSTGNRLLALHEADLIFAWPLRGRVSSRFGSRSGQPHEGIDIPARRGTPIRAAEAGRVVHSGDDLGDYGNVVILKHSGRYSTIYAHNQKNLVRQGEFVEKGQVIAQVGKSGNASGPHVHFEIRRDRRAQDPIDYLP